MTVTALHGNYSDDQRGKPTITKGNKLMEINILKMEAFKLPPPPTPVQHSYLRLEKLYSHTYTEGAKSVAFYHGNLSPRSLQCVSTGKYRGDRPQMIVKSEIGKPSEAITSLKTAVVFI